MESSRFPFSTAATHTWTALQTFNTGVTLANNSDITLDSGSQIICDDTTDSTSGTTGSIQTDGGIGVAKSIVAAGNTASTSTTTGTIIVTGGIGCSGAIYMGAASRVSTTTAVFDLFGTGNTVSELKLWTASTLRCAWQSDGTSTRLQVNGATVLNAPAAGTSIELPVSTLVGTSGTTGSAPLYVSPSSWPAGVPTAAQVGINLGLANAGSNDYRTIGAGYFTGATNIPCVFGYNQTSGAGFTKGDFIVATRSVTTDTAPTVRMRITDAGDITGTSGIVSTNATSGIGYATGAGGTVTQTTSRTTGVTINKVCGEITLFSTAGSTTPASFTVTNSAMAATDSVILNQKSGTDLYHLLVTAKAAGSFQITAFTTGGTTSEAPVISFAIIKGVAA